MRKKRLQGRKGRKPDVVIPAIPELVEHADAIRIIGRQSFEGAVEIGQRLVRCRELLKAQRVWLAWLDVEFGWSRRTADRFIDLFRAKDKVRKLRSLGVGISGFYLLTKASSEAIEEMKRHVKAGGRLRVADVKRRMRDSVQEGAEGLAAAVTSMTSSRDETSIFDRVIGRGGPPDAGTQRMFTRRLEALAGQQPLSMEALSPEQQRPQSEDFHRAAAERFSDWLANVARGLAAFEPAAETAAALPAKHLRVDEDAERVMRFLDQFRRARRKAGKLKLA